MSDGLASLAAFSIRRVREADAGDVPGLNGQLGYPATVAEVRERLTAIAKIPSQAFFVACIGEEVIGWIDVSHCICSRSRSL